MMRALGHERSSLVGHDRGSYVALGLALDHPDAVDRVALLDCFWRDWADDVRVGRSPPVTTCRRRRRTC
jgi:pimeloyl-ACP methyl ester carboxylesterase